MGAASSGTPASLNAKHHVRLVATPFGPRLPTLSLKPGSKGCNASTPCCFGFGAWQQTRAYHTSVVVDAMEVCFSFAGVERYAVNGAEVPTHCNLKESSITLDLGAADVSLTEFLKRLRNNFLAGTYDLLRKNCNSFSDCAIYFLTGARLDEKYRTLEAIGLAAEKHVSLVSTFTRGGYRMNPRADNFDLEKVIIELGERKSERLVENITELEAPQNWSLTSRLGEIAQVTMVAAEAELTELFQSQAPRAAPIDDGIVEWTKTGDGSDWTPKRISQSDTLGRCPELDALSTTTLSDPSVAPLPALARTLIELGFSESQSRGAAARCSSVEAAVDWITAQPLPRN